MYSIDPLKRMMADPLRSQDLTPKAFIDCFFYNVQALDADELRQLAILGARHREQPGTVILVEPEARRPGHPRIKVIFGKGWQKHVPDDVDTVIVAGVGSSMLGAAALAKDIADRLNRCVVGVVPGTGLLSAPIDGFFGLFKYGPLNLLVNHWMSLSQLFKSTDKEDPLVVAHTGDASKNDLPQVVLQELIRRSSVKRLIGHSKGSLELSNAVAAEEKSLLNRADKLRIGTIGAVMALPRYVDCCQVLGSFDELGLLNSRVNVPRNIVWGASHWLNPQIPLALSIRDQVWGKFGNGSAFS